MELQISKNGPKMANNNNEEDILISVKEEPLVFLDEQQHENLGWVEDLPKAIEGLREIGPPPFLKKTYEMVDDPNTDEIISWTDLKTSFVVWDTYKFSIDLLPKYFKHNNFSSFVRQLNTYSFRKIHPDRWEFANEGFQKGKKHLLKHIQRRKHNSRNMQQPISVQQSWLDSTNPRVDQELEKLKTDQSTLQAEISKLRQQQDNTHRYLATVEEHLRVTERKQKHIVVFMIKCLKNPLFLEHCIEKMKKKRAGLSGGEVLKRRRLDEIPTVDFDDQAQEEVAMVRSEIQTLFSSDDSVGPSPGPAQTSVDDVCSENFVLWEKLMEDDMIYEEEGEGKEQSDIVLELEDLIANPPEWDVHRRGLAEPVV